MHAEDAYLFRHALLRDAAYQMQPPQTRSLLHRLALEALEHHSGGRANELSTVGTLHEADEHPSDAIAFDLAEHARLAQSAGDGSEAELQPVRRLYLLRAAWYFERTQQQLAACGAWREFATLVDGAERGAALDRGAFAVQSIGNTNLAEVLYSDAVKSFEKCGTPVSGFGTVLDHLAGLYKDTGRIAESRETYLRALDVSRAANDKRSECNALGGLANLYRHVGDMGKAEATSAQAISIAGEHSFRKEEGSLLGNLALLYQITGRMAEAESTHLGALRIHLQFGNRRSEGIVRGNLAQLYQETGRIEDADAMYQQALAINRETGHRRAEAIAIANLANLQHNQGAYRDAERNQLEALAIHREIGNRRGEGVVMGNLAHLLHDTDRDDEAERMFERAISIHREILNRRFEGLVQCDYGMFKLETGHVEVGQRIWKMGAKILIEIGDEYALKRKRQAMTTACAEAGIEPFDVPEHKPPVGSE